MVSRAETVVGQGLDHPAVPRLALASRLDHALQLGAQSLELGDFGLDLR